MISPELEDPQLPKRRISCSDSAFPALSHEAALMVINDLGIEAVDICVFAGYRNNPPRTVVQEPQRAAEMTFERLQRSSLDAVDVFAMIGDPWDALAVNHPDAEERAEAYRQFEALLVFARVLGSPALTILPGADFEGVDPHAGLALAATELQRRAERASEVGIELAIEPHVGSIVATPERTRELLELAPQVLLTLDPSHFIYQGIAQDDLEPLLARTRHVQLRQASPGNIQTPVHEGSMDIARFVRQLDESGYPGYLGIEYQWERAMDFNRVDCIGETAAMRDLLNNLR